MRRSENSKSKTILTVAVALSLSISAGAMAAGSHGGGHSSGGHSSASEMKSKMGHGDNHAHGHSNPAGEPGKKADVSRTLEIDMTENRYSQEKITVKAGETIRFMIHNKGELVHKFNKGTPTMHKGESRDMMMMPDHGVLEADKINHAKMKMDMGGGKTMEHDDPNSVLLEPGKSGEIVWKFSKAGTFEIACNVPGHYDAGMVGELTVK